MIPIVRRVCFAVLILLLTTSQVALAQDEDITLEVMVGFDGHCRLEEWCPFYITLSNQGPEVQGSLVVRDDRPGSESSTYSVPISLPPQSRKGIFLYYPITLQSTRLIVAFSSGNSVNISRRITPRYLDRNDRLYGVISSAPSSLSLLNSAAPVSGEAFVANLSLDNLPPDPLGWEPLDILIIDDTDTLELTTDQHQALEVWVNHGGHLIIGGGVGADRTMAGLSDLLPVAFQGTVTLDSLEALGEYAEVTTAPGSYLVADTSLVDGDVLVEQDGITLLARRHLGAGSLDFLACEAGTAAFSDWQDGIQFWLRLTDLRASDRQRLAVQGSWSTDQAIRAIPGLKPAPAYCILGFLLVYTLLVGPVNYLILRRLDRRELAWVTIPALIVGFTVLAYVYGYLIRGGEVILHRLSLVHVPENSSVGRAVEMVGVFSPLRSRYDIEIETAGVRQITMYDYGDPTSPPLDVTQAPFSSSLSDLSVDVGEVQAFIAEGYVQVTPPQANIQVVQSYGGKVRVAGTIRNGSLPLQSAFLISNNYMLTLGNLEPNQLIDEPGMIDQPLESSTRLGPYDPLAWDDPDYLRRDTLRDLLVTNLAHLEPGIYLAGWSEQAPVGVTIDRSSVTNSNLTLYVFKLPVAPLDQGTAVTIRAALITPEIEDTSDSIDLMPGSVSMFGGGSATLLYRIWPEALPNHIDGLNLILSPPFQSESAIPSVALWNWSRAGWDYQEISWGENSVPDPGAYVNSDGTIRVRIASDRYIQFGGVSFTIEGER